ncbi:Peroxidase, family 2-domain-containing protein [Hyaloscypha finlandica]|nr:Peroxidase, family 2-domain-containing protein [Hyaloscypha finlandica]
MIVELDENKRNATYGPGDVRSPCSGPNSLTNHGFISHNGKSLTIPILIKALNDGINVGADFATVIGGAGLLSIPANPLATSFDLASLNEHNSPIEHDVRLSRADNYENNGDNYSFNQTIFKSALAYCGGINATSIPVAAEAKSPLVRLPDVEGWRPPTKQSNLLTLGDMILSRNAANGEVIPES